MNSCACGHGFTDNEATTDITIHLYDDSKAHKHYLCPVCGLLHKSEEINNKKQEVTKMSTIDLTSKIREIRELQQLIEEATAEADALKDEIKAHMTAQGMDEMTVDVFKVRYKPVTASRFDTTAFKATHAELYGQYCKQTVSRRFSVA